MSWMLTALAVWTAVAVTLALFIGRSIRLRDERDISPAHAAAPDYVPAEWTVPAADPR
jgi:hypothetical protein